MLQAIINFFKQLFIPQKGTTGQNTSNKQKKVKNYRPKKLLTQTELKFFNAIKKAINENYILLPQINLASIIERTDEHKYQNELYRNIDFAIFDKSYNPIALIEINDKTHKDKKRIARDIKVKEICNNANIPLITFWTDYGVNQEYINKRIADCLTKTNP